MGAKRLGLKIEAKRLGGKRLGGKHLGGQTSCYPSVHIFVLKSTFEISHPREKLPSWSYIH